MLHRLAGRELEQLLDGVGAPAYMVEIQPDGTFILLYANKAMQRATGYQDIRGKVAEELVPPEQAKIVTNRWRQCVESREQIETQDRIQVPSGFRWWRTVFTPIFNADGEVVRVLATTADITREREIQDTLRYQHLLLTVQLQLTPNGVLVVDADGNVLSANARFREIWGLTEDMLRHGRSLSFPHVLSQLVEPEAFRRQVEDLYKDLSKPVDGAELHLKDGRIIEWFSRGLIDDLQIGRGRVWFFRDVTHNRTIERQLREAHALQQAILDSASQIIVTVGNDGLIQSINKAGVQQLGYSAEELVGKASPLIFHDSEEIEERRLAMSVQLGRDVTVDELINAPVRAGETTRQEWHYIRKDGSRFPGELSLHLLMDDTGNQTGFLGIVTDISERKEAERRLLELAITDPLTKLANRRHFLDRAEQALRRARRYGEPIAIAVIDLDRFKQINDTYGHATGDVVLAASAAAMAETLRASDLLCRWGGEEFAALFVNTSPEMAQTVAERLRHAAENLSIFHEGQRLLVTISIGLSNWAPSEATLDWAFLRADRALYRAKDAGRNNVQAEWHSDPAETLSSRFTTSH